MLPRRAIGLWMACLTCWLRTAGDTKAAQTVAPDVATPLTQASSVRSLSPEQAARGLPVQVRGVVTFVFNSRSCFVQDASAGIFVGNGVEAPGLAPGDLVRVKGASDPGE